MKRAVYLDNAATTPVRPEVLEAMLPYLRADKFGNPSSAHRYGREARAGVEDAKRQIADALGVESGQIVFTSGGTEADNLAVVGGTLAARSKGAPFRVAVSTIEHKAVLAAAHTVEQMGAEITSVSVDSCGRVEPDAVTAALESGLGLMSIMWVNNEIGAVQDIPAIAEAAHSRGITFHTDAVQAVGKIPCTLSEIGCTFATISGHKIGAAKGIGALIVKDKSAVEPILHGGQQQQGVRPGTENVPGIVGLAIAVELAVSELEEIAPALSRLRKRFDDGIRAAVPDAVIHGADAQRAPHITNVSIPGTDTETMLMHLDLAGIACSSGSACTTGSVEASHVMNALGIDRELGESALRFSLSKNTSTDDIDYVLQELPAITRKIRKLAGVLGR